MVSRGLKIKNVHKGSAGEYKCRLSLSNDAHAEKLIDLKIGNAPRDIYADQGW